MLMVLVGFEPLPSMAPASTQDTLPRDRLQSAVLLAPELNRPPSTRVITLGLVPILLVLIGCANRVMLQQAMPMLLPAPDEAMPQVTSKVLLLVLSLL